MPFSNSTQYSDQNDMSNIEIVTVLDRQNVSQWEGSCARDSGFSAFLAGPITFWGR